MTQRSAVQLEKLNADHLTPPPNHLAEATPCTALRERQFKAAWHVGRYFRWSALPGSTIHADE
jgi:hypothetical protein